MLSGEGGRRGLSEGELYTSVGSSCFSDCDLCPKEGRFVFKRMLFSHLLTLMNIVCYKKENSAMKKSAASERMRQLNSFSPFQLISVKMCL